MSGIRTLTCNDLDLGLDVETATIPSIISRGHSLLVGKHGYLAIEDRTTGRFHFKPEDKVPAEPLPGKDVVVRQSVPDADMILTQCFTVREECIEWAVSLATNSPDIREIHLHFVVPVFGSTSCGFTANARCPLVPGRGLDHMMVVYGPDMWNEESFHCSVLPLVSSYDPQRDAGLVIIQPPDIRKPRMEYFFVREQPDISIVVRWTHLRLQRTKKVEARMLLVPIRGCWREALRCVYDRYRDYFAVHEPSIFRHEGPMVCGELIPEDVLDRLVREQQIAWQEIHANVFEHYGNYAPEKDAWPNWVTKGKLEYFDLERLSRTQFRDMHTVITDKSECTITRQKLNEYVDLLHSKGVGAYLYTNPVVLDADHVNQYPDSLAESAEGTPLFRDYYRNVPMYPSTATTWGKHLDEMTSRALKIFPEIDGFFLDELHWNQFDFAHDDGISARNDKPVAMIGFAVQDAARRICTAAHERGKAVWANGPNTLEVVHYVDGFMAECSWEWLTTVMYLGLEKPVVLLMSGKWGVPQFKDALKSALYAGAMPGLVEPEYLEPECIDVLQRYQPLFKMLQRRKWILHPYAVTTDTRLLRANCFALPDGDYAVTLISSTESDYKMMSTDGYTLSQDMLPSGESEPARIRLSWPGVNRASSAELFSVSGPKQGLELKLQPEPEAVSFEIAPLEAAVVRIGFGGTNHE